MAKCIYAINAITLLNPKVRKYSLKQSVKLSGCKLDSCSWS